MVVLMGYEWKQSESSNRVLFCEKVIMCDMLLSNGDIIYRLRKFSTRVRLEGQVEELGGKVSYEGQMRGLGSKVSYEGQVGGLDRTFSACE